jgi:hypothetical protein
MKKFIKRLNEFLPQSMQMNNPTTKPTPTTVPTKPGKRPGPIPTERPSTTPKPQAKAMDVYNHFIDTLREVSGEFEFDLNYLMQKYEMGSGSPTTKPTPTTVPTKPGKRPGPIPTERPSTTPKPQAFGQFESLNLKSFSQFVNEARHEENPAFSDDYKSRFPERIRQEAGETNRRIGGREVSKDMRAVVQKILQIQRGHEKELEQLAYDIIMDHYGSILEYVTLKIRFPRDENEAKEECKECAPKPPKKKITDRRTIAEINRRKVGKMVMQAEAKRSKALLNFAREGLIDILGEENGNLYVQLLNQIGDMAHFADLITPEDVMLGFWTRNNPAGVVSVSWDKKEEKEEVAKEVLDSLEQDEEPRKEDLEELFADEDTPQILAIGNDFSMLLHEAIKGIWQLIISAAIPEDITVSNVVIENTDTLADEIEDLKYGPFIAKDLLAFVNSRYSDKVDSIDNFRERLFGKMITESNPMTFLKMIRAILMQDYSPKYMTRIDELAQEVEDELLDYESQMRDYEAQMKDYNLMQSYRSNVEEYPQEPTEDEDLSQMSIAELQQELKNALEYEDYMLASEIKKMIARKSANESRRYSMGNYWK